MLDLILIIFVVIGILLITTGSDNVLVYDVETITLSDYDKKTLKGIKHSTFVVCIGCYDSKTGKYHSFIHPDFKRFKKLIRGKKIVGFNSLAYDDKRCEELGIHIKTDFDVYERVVKAYKHATGGKKLVSGYNLDKLSQANGGAGKLKKPGSVEKLWNEGKIKELIDYNLQDVQVTYDLYMKRKGIVDPLTGKRFNLTTVR